MGEVDCEIALGLKRSDHNLYSTFQDSSSMVHSQIVSISGFNNISVGWRQSGLGKDILQKCPCNENLTRRASQNGPGAGEPGKAASVLLSNSLTMKGISTLT